MSRPSNEIEEGRLTGAIRADQPDDFPGEDGKVYFVHRRQTTELLGELYRFE
jgi:hypothetical protein